MRPKRDKFAPEAPFLGAAEAPVLTQLAGQPRPAFGASAEPRGGVTRATVLAEAALAAVLPIETHRARCGENQGEQSENSSVGKHHAAGSLPRAIGGRPDIKRSRCCLQGEEPTTPSGCSAAHIRTFGILACSGKRL